MKGQGSTGCSLVLMGLAEQVRQVAGVAATSPTAYRGPTGPKGTVWTLRQVSCSTDSRRFLFGAGGSFCFRGRWLSHLLSTVRCSHMAPGLAR